MILGWKTILWSLVILLILGSMGKGLIKLFMALLAMILFVSLEFGMSGSGLLGLILFLVYASGILILFSFMFCLFSNSFKFMSKGRMWGMFGGLGLGFLFLNKQMIWEDEGGELGAFLGSEWLFMGSFFTSLFLMALWVTYKILCMKNGCLRPFF